MAAAGAAALAVAGASGGGGAAGVAARTGAAAAGGAAGGGAAAVAGLGAAAFTAVWQAGESWATFFCRQAKASAPPGVTPVQRDMKSARHDDRMALTCSGLGCWLHAGDAARTASTMSAGRIFTPLPRWFITSSPPRAPIFVHDRRRSEPVAGVIRYPDQRSPRKGETQVDGAASCRPARSWKAWQGGTRTGSCGRPAGRVR